MGALRVCLESILRTVLSATCSLDFVDLYTGNQARGTEQTMLSRQTLRLMHAI